MHSFETHATHKTYAALCTATGALGAAPPVTLGAAPTGAGSLLVDASICR